MIRLGGTRLTDIRTPTGAATHNSSCRCWFRKRAGNIHSPATATAGCTNTYCTSLGKRDPSLGCLHMRYRCSLCTRTNRCKSTARNNRTHIPRRLEAPTPRTATWPQGCRPITPPRATFSSSSITSSNNSLPGVPLLSIS